MMSFSRVIFLVLCIISCSKNPEVQVYEMYRDAKKAEIIANIKNNTEKNFYLLSPALELYSNKYATNIMSYLIDGYVTNEKIDSIVCSVYINDEVCNTKEFENYHRPIILLPKQSIKKLRYKYTNEEKYLIDICRIHFPYNEHHNIDTERWYTELKNKLDSSNIIQTYEFYNKKIEN